MTDVLGKLRLCLIKNMRERQFSVAASVTEIQTSTQGGNMDYGNAESCPQCEEQMTVIPSPTQGMLEASSGYEEFARVVMVLTDEKLRLDEVAIAFCSDCRVDAIIGPQVSVSGVIVDEL